MSYSYAEVPDRETDPPEPYPHDDGEARQEAAAEARAERRAALRDPEAEAWAFGPWDEATGHAWQVCAFGGRVHVIAPGTEPLQALSPDEAEVLVEAYRDEAFVAAVRAAIEKAKEKER
jgi:hypothetical protein